MKLWKETNIRFIFFPDGFFSQECNDTEFSQWWRDFWELVDIHEVLKGNYLKYFKSFKISLRVVYKINKKNHFNIRVKVWTHLTWYHGYYYVILSHVTPSDPKTLTKHMLSFNSELFCILIGKKTRLQGNHMLIKRSVINPQLTNMYIKKIRVFCLILSNFNWIFESSELEQNKMNKQ